MQKMTTEDALAAHDKRDQRRAGDIKRWLNNQEDRIGRLEKAVERLRMAQVRRKRIKTATMQDQQSDGV